LLFPIPAGDPDEAGVVRVVLERLFERADAFEECADLVVDELLVHDAAQCGERLRASRVTAGRHRDLLIPGEDACCASEIGDLDEALSERAKVGVHREGLYRRR
jgi:hypothetical protein